jgi:hypothetical protein
MRIRIDARAAWMSEKLISSSSDFQTHRTPGVKSISKGCHRTLLLPSVPKRRSAFPRNEPF